jgi:hypothetical protein
VSYDEIEVGDAVWCLAWIGMPFVVVGKDEDTKCIQLDGAGPCSLPEGARIDLYPENHYQVTKELWDQLWYWPDIAGERYDAVVDRFVRQHRTGQVVNGYVAGMLTVTEDPKRAGAFRLNLDEFDHFGQIQAEPVAAIADDSTLLRCWDESIDDDRWVTSGPTAPLELKMIGYRWALTYGKLVLNWRDFD